jgi:PAS domain S-box-containing protein
MILCTIRIAKKEKVPKKSESPRSTADMRLAGSDSSLGVNRMLNSRLIKRYFLIVFIVILFALATLYGITDWVLNSSVQSQIQYRDELIARTLSKRLGLTFQSVISDLRYVSPYVYSTKKNRPFYVAEMERIFAYDPIYLFIQAYDRNGVPTLRVPDKRFPSPLRLHGIHRRLQWSKTHFISSLVELPDGTKTIAVAYPALDSRGRYRGGVVAYLNLETLSAYLEEFSIGQEGINIVVDREGNVIGHSNRRDIGKSLNHHPVVDFLQKDRFGLWEGNIADQEMMVAYRPLSMGQMGLIVGESTQQAATPVRHVRKLLLQGFLGVMLLALFLTLLGTSRVVKPVLNLIRQVKEYQRGQRRRFEPVDTRDELQDLSTVLRRMADELTEKERRLFYILESIPYAVITTDPQGKITTFNRGAERLTLFRREEAIGKSIFDLPLKRHKEEFVSWKTLKEGRAFEEVESYIFDKEGKKRDVRIYSSLFRGEADEIIGALVVIRDVGEIKRLEKYLKQSERLAALGQLTSGIAHEIKNPLSIIQAAVESIRLELNQSPMDKREIGELTGDILETVQRMNRLLTDFLKLAKEKESPQPEIIDLVTVLQEFLGLIRKKFSDQGIEVYTEFQTDTAWVRADKDHLVQVFLNIALNSLQAMEEGGRFHLRLLEREHLWQIEIEDTGKGIPEPQLQWIFDPLFSTKPEGTGMGLAIAHDMVSRYHGRIWATSEEHKGTTLFIQLPKGRREDSP